MKHSLLLLMLFFYLPVFAQRICKGSIAVVGDEFDNTDSLLIKNGYSTRLIYKRVADPKARETLTRREEYDGKGELSRLVLGLDILHGKIDLLLTCSRLSDSSWLAVAKYPTGSDLLTFTSFSLDTIIDGKREIIPLYKKDAAGNLVIRAVIGKRVDGFPAYIKNYDLHDSLVQIYYPTYKGHYKKEWYDTVADQYGRTITYHMIDNDVIYRFAEIYNKGDRLLQDSYLTQNLDSKDYAGNSRIFGYGEDSNLVCRVTQFVGGATSIERWYRKDKRLVRYTEDDDLADDSLNEDRRYDDFGNLVFYKSRSNGVMPPWAYFSKCDISATGLCLRKEEYYLGKLTTILTYRYK